MSIGEKLKRLRENNGMTRKDAADKLKELGIDISDKTLYGYESGRNSANADMFLALCQIYRCNNIMETFSDSVSDVLFTNKEWTVIEKYRDLDVHGRDMVDTVLDKEWKRSKAEAERKASKPISIIEARANKDLEADAANQDPNATPEQTSFDDDVMDDPDF